MRLSKLMWSCKNRKISPEEVDEDGTVAGLFYLITLSRLNSEDHKDNFWHLSRFLDFFVTFSFNHFLTLLFFIGWDLAEFIFLYSIKLFFCNLQNSVEISTGLADKRSVSFWILSNIYSRRDRIFHRKVQRDYQCCFPNIILVM